jgi:hypothetical protein
MGDKAYVQALQHLYSKNKLLNPGDTISITFLRAGKEINAKTKVVAK